MIENNPLPSEPRDVPSSSLADDLPTNVGPVRGLAGILLILLGMAVLIASLIIRDGNITGRMPTFPFAGMLTKLVGVMVFAVGMFLLGKGGMVRFGCVLLVGGCAAYFGNLIINHEYGGAANGLGGLAALLGIILIAIANGWLGQAPH